MRDVEPDVLDVTGASSRQIGEAAASRGIVLHELTPLRASLEDAYMDLTGDAAEYRAAPPAPLNETDRLELAA